MWKFKRLFRKTGHLEVYETLADFLNDEHATNVKIVQDYHDGDTPSLRILYKTNSIEVVC